MFALDLPELMLPEFDGGCPGVLPEHFESGVNTFTERSPERSGSTMNTSWSPLLESLGGTLRMRVQAVFPERSRSAPGALRERSRR